jgi:hypothetical protein
VYGGIVVPLTLSHVQLHTDQKKATKEWGKQKSRLKVEESVLTCLGVNLGY